MAAPAWSFVLTDSSYRPVGEILNAANRRVARQLRGLSTGQLSVKLDNPLADQLSRNVGFIKAYRNGALQVVGPIISAEETSDKTGSSLTVNFTDAGWFMQKRLVGKSATGTVYATTSGPLSVAHAMIDASNGEFDLGLSRQTGITYTDNGISLPSYTAGPYKTLLDCIKEISSGAVGFEWYIQPVENYAAGAVTGSKIGTFWATDTTQQTTTLGLLRPEAIFEYGGRNNIASYKITTSRDTQANTVYHNASAGPDAPGYPTVSASDVASQASWGLLQDLASADLLDLGLRQQLVNRHIALRSQPRRVVEFTPIPDMGVGRVPSFGTDYNLGDTVRARLLYNSTVRLDGRLRIYGISWEIDDKNNEGTTLTLSDSGGTA